MESLGRFPRKSLSMARNHPALFVFGLSLFFGPSGTRPVCAQDTNGVQAQIAEARDRENKAMDKVRQIVNQPVPSNPQTEDMEVSVYQGGWFHPGAMTPDYKNADVTKTQDLNYAHSTYVSSTINPGTVWLGRDLEFNSQLKFFYTDRSVPKKKLTLAEMQEINQLYRTIADCEDKIVSLQPPPPPPPDQETNQVDQSATVRILQKIPRLDKADGVLAIIGLVALYTGYRVFRRR